MYVYLYLRIYICMCMCIYANAYARVLLCTSQQAQFASTSFSDDTLFLDVTTARVGFGIWGFCQNLVMFMSISYPLRSTLLTLPATSPEVWPPGSATFVQKWRGSINAGYSWGIWSSDVVVAAASLLIRPSSWPPADQGPDSSYSRSKTIPHGNSTLCLSLRHIFKYHSSNRGYL